MLVAVCLVLLTVLTVFSVILGNSWTGTLGLMDIDSTIFINGTGTEFATSGINFSLNIDPITGFITAIIVVVTIASILGIQIFSSGLSDASVRIMTIGIIYSSIWTTISLLASAYIFLIPVFGALIYVVLTIAFAIGVIQKIDGENS